MLKNRNISIKVNMLLNSIKSLMGVIFPLITFPYISRILGVDNIGKYNFANSVISYFILFAGLGISSYAIRSGAELRENKVELKKFVNQLFTINIISTIVSYSLLAVCFLLIAKFHEYTALLIILSGQILFKTIGIEWIYSIYEDFAYITVRSIIFQFLSLILMFCFVRNQGDVEIYAAITVLSSVGSNVLNFVHARKYCKIELIKKIDFIKHLRPIMVFFATAITVTIYVSSDLTILGLICDDHTVGIYAVSVNVYKALKTILSAVIVVSIPRMSLLWGKGELTEFSNLGKEIYQTLLTLIFPSILGIILLSKEIVLLISGPDYMPAQSSLILLCIAILFCLGAGFWSQGVLIPQNKESVVFIITIISAVINILVNLILIPFWAEKAAAVTTLISEVVVFIFCRHKAILTINLSGTSTLIVKVLLGCLPMIGIYYMCANYLQNILLRTGSMILLSVLVYTFVEIMLGNRIVTDIYMKIVKRIKRIVSVGK